MDEFKKYKKGDKIRFRYLDAFEWDAIVEMVMGNNKLFVKTIGHGEGDDVFTISINDIVK